MKIDDAMAIATQMARGTLEDMARQKGERNFGTVMVCYRGETPIAMLVSPPNRDTLLKAAHLAARGFAPDVLALTHDTYVSMAPWKEALDPRTGKRWAANPGDGPGPLQTYVEEFGYDGTVVDCLVTHVVTRAGGVEVEPHPYEVDDRIVKWLDFLPDKAMYSDDGVSAALRQMMAMPTLDDVMSRAEVPEWAASMAASDPERARWAYDMVTTTVIESEIGAGVRVALYAEKGSPREQMLRRKFPRSQVVDPSRWR